MWNRKKQKKKELLEQLYMLYEQKMYAAAYSILHQAEQAEDAVQDCFIKLMKYLPDIDTAESPKTKSLVMRILKTTAIDQYRKNRRDGSHFVSEEAAAVEENMRIFPINAAENRAYIEVLLAELPKEYREVIKLRCYYGFTNRETAEILQISEANASKRLDRARERILSKMNKEADYEKKESGLPVTGSREAGAGRRF